MRILAIETSCDETAVALLEFSATSTGTSYKIIAERLHSQADIHTHYGGVYPTIAKREHQRILPPLIHALLSDHNLLSTEKTIQMPEKWEKIAEREPTMAKLIKKLFFQQSVSGIDALAVTQGPGLAPALWVGVNCVRSLALLWNLPIIPVNHMEGHIIAGLADPEEHIIATPTFPILSLLVSGGHTELVLSENAGVYKKIGKTLDDAAGEAFDKAARMLDLPYPGGPEISKLATVARKRTLASPVSLPRPMLHDKSLNFSYAGLKTALRIFLEKNQKPSDNERCALAMEFEDAAIEPLVEKTRRAIEIHHPRTVVVGGGVSANTHLREKITDLCTSYSETTLHLPKLAYATDNAVMIALTAYSNSRLKDEHSLFEPPTTLTPLPNLSFPEV